MAHGWFAESLSPSIAVSVKEAQAYGDEDRGSCGGHKSNFCWVVIRLVFVLEGLRSDDIGNGKCGGDDGTTSDLEWMSVQKTKTML